MANAPVGVAGWAARASDVKAREAARAAVSVQRRRVCMGWVGGREQPASLWAACVTTVNSRESDRAHGIVACDGQKKPCRRLQAGWVGTR